jgi:hypothetical protein
VTGSSDDQAKAKKDLLETLAKEVGADSAKELLEILKQKVDEKNNPQILISTVAPTKSVDQKITDLKNKHPTTAKKIETVEDLNSFLHPSKQIMDLPHRSTSASTWGAYSLDHFLQVNRKTILLRRMIYCLHRTNSLPCPKFLDF